jgi:catechol 2,3-dioxygenase-like lactoylglutathione lyase family enzyme
MAWKLGTVGHFGLAVRDPKVSARWWIENLGLEHQFDFPNGVAVGNDAVTIALHEGVPHPGTLGHLSFHLPTMHALREALGDLRDRGVRLEDPGDEIGPEAPGSPHLAIWFHDPDGYRWELSVQNGALSS